MRGVGAKAAESTGARSADTPPSPVPQRPRGLSLPPSPSQAPPGLNSVTRTTCQVRRAALCVSNFLAIKTN